MKKNKKKQFSKKNGKKKKNEILIKKKKLKRILKKYNNGKQDDSIELLKAINDLNVVFSNVENIPEIANIFQDIQVELIGLATETNSQRHKIVQSGTKRVITEYLLTHLNEIERTVINDSKTKMRLFQKIKKLINEYKSTNYFREIYLITIVDDVIDQVYGDEYTLSKYIQEIALPLIDNTDKKEELEKFFLIYQNSIDGAEISDFKISYRKVIEEKLSYNDILADIWTKLLDFVGEDGCNIIRNSLYLFNSKKIDHNNTLLNPIIYALKSSETFINEEFKKVEVNGKVFYGASIFTLEDSNQAKFERFFSKLQSCGYTEEAMLLKAYLSNNINLFTEKIITEKFSNLHEELFVELLSINKNKFKKTCIGHILLSKPTNNIFTPDGKLNFIIDMVMQSIFKMSEILLISDFEFQEFQKETLITLQQISKLRDIETANHQDRVTIYTKILAESLKNKKNDNSLTKLIENNNITGDSDYHIIEKEYIRDLLYSASLHDLGKLGINDNILKSKHKLNKEEYNIMKKHTTLGYQRLYSITKMSRKKSFLELAASLAENHHEKWDGTGYPNGKKRYEIPLSARILAIADVYDALRIKRSYKKAFSHEEALNMIVAEKNKSFDPVLIDIFVENSDKMDEAYNSITYETNIYK